MTFINWETGSAASYILFSFVMVRVRDTRFKNCEIYIQGLKMMDEIAEVST